MVHCNQCEADWEPRKSNGSPVQCPRCKRVDWAEKKKWSVADMARAHQVVAQAVRSGRLVRDSCCVCGSSEGVEGHHDDYDKPLAVIWLCKKHHEQRHSEIGYPLVDYNKKDTKPQKPMAIYECKRCGEPWCFHGTGRPIRCGKCKSPYWDRERQDAVECPKPSGVDRRIPGKVPDDVLPVKGSSVGVGKGCPECGAMSGHQKWCKRK